MSANEESENSIWAKSPRTIWTVIYWFIWLRGQGSPPIVTFLGQLWFSREGEIASYLYSMSCLCKTSVKSPSRLFPNPPKLTNELHSLKNSTIFSLLNLLVLWHTLAIDIFKGGFSFMFAFLVCLFVWLF